MPEAPQKWNGNQSYFWHRPELQSYGWETPLLKGRSCVESCFQRRDKTNVATKFEVEPGCMAAEFKPIHLQHIFFAMLQITEPAVSQNNIWWKETFSIEFPQAKIIVHIDIHRYELNVCEDHTVYRSTVRWWIRRFSSDVSTVVNQRN